MQHINHDAVKSPTPPMDALLIASIANKPKKKKTHDLEGYPDLEIHAIHSFKRVPGWTMDSA